MNNAECNGKGNLTIYFSNAACVKQVWTESNLLFNVRLLSYFQILFGTFLRIGSLSVWLFQLETKDSTRFKSPVKKDPKDVGTSKSLTNILHVELIIVFLSTFWIKILLLSNCVLFTFAAVSKCSLICVCVKPNEIQ